MRVILVNGSPKEHGRATYTALTETAKTRELIPARAKPERQQGF